MVDGQDLDKSAQSAEAPWKEKNEEMARYRTERENAENEASLKVGLCTSSLNELESKHRACQRSVAGSFPCRPVS